MDPCSKYFYLGGGKNPAKWVTYVYGGSDGKESDCNAVDLGSIPGLVRLPTREKGMTTHYSILAWRIPWTEEPDGLQPKGSAELDTTELLTKTFTFFFCQYFVNVTWTNYFISFFLSFQHCKIAMHKKCHSLNSQHIIFIKSQFYKR